jgi:hypothetical protein
MVPATRRFGVRVVIENGFEVCPFAVAVIFTSPALELKAVPKLSTLIEEPVKDDTVILSAPAVMFQVVEEPPLDVSWMEVAYPETVRLAKNQTVLGPDIVGMTFVGALGCSWDRSQLGASSFGPQYMLMLCALWFVAPTATPLI